jgi:hypothetical protein
VIKRRWNTAAAVLVLSYACLGGAPRPFTWQAALSTSVCGVVVLTAALLARRRPGRRPASVELSRGGRAAWVAWTIAVSGWELWAWASQPRSEHPTISSLTDSLVATYPGRSIALLGWLALGWWLAGR